MKRWHYLMAAGLLMSAATLLCIWHLATSDPKFNGKRLSVWLAGFDSDKQQERDAAAAALRQMSTNALPFLVEQRGSYDSPLKLKFLSLMSRQSIIQIHNVPAHVRQERACKGLWALRPVAMDAIPMLISLYERSNEHTSRIHPFLVLATLGDMGPGAKAAVPLLLREATNADMTIRQEAVWALGQIHAAPESAVPVLITALSDSDTRVRELAARGLSHYGREAQPAIPTLQHLIEDPGGMCKTDPFSGDYRSIRGAATDAVNWIRDASSPETVVPALIETLSNPDMGVRDRAVRRLGRFGPDARLALAKLLELLEEENRALKDSPNSLSHRAMRGGLVRAVAEINSEITP